LTITILVVVATAWMLARTVPPSNSLEQTSAQPIVPELPAPEEDVISQGPNGDVILFPARPGDGGEDQAHSTADGQAVAETHSKGTVEFHFRIVKLPPQGMFRVRLKYSGTADDAGDKYVVVLDGESRVRDMRGAEGDITDEFFMAVPRTGVHQLSVRGAGETKNFELKSMELLCPAL
jgi:hypothetical protein